MLSGLGLQILWHRRFKTVDVPTGVFRNAPEFCNVYIIAKGKLSSSRNATIPAPSAPTSRQSYSNSSAGSGFSDPRMMQSNDSIGKNRNFLNLFFVNFIKNIKDEDKFIYPTLLTVSDRSSPFSRRSTEENDFIK